MDPCLDRVCHGDRIIGAPKCRGDRWGNRAALVDIRSADRCGCEHNAALLATSLLASGRASAADEKREAAPGVLRLCRLPDGDGADPSTFAQHAVEPSCIRTSCELRRSREYCSIAGWIMGFWPFGNAD